MMDYQGDFNPTANAGDDPPKYNISQSETDISIISDATYSSNITSILASAFNLMGNHPEAKEAVASDLMAINQT